MALDSSAGAINAPGWLDRTEYPFAPRWFDAGPGRMHYVDEGTGEPVLLVHGTPTWSFMYRRLIAALSPRYRVIAPDNLGFGLSDRPTHWSYTPEGHAANLEALIRHLELRDLTLIVHDWGGPLGLSYALENPGNVRRVVLMNTFMWPLMDDGHFSRPARLFGGGFGRLLYSRLNLSPRFLMPMAFGDRRRLTKDVHRHYTAPFPDPRSRRPLFAWATSLSGAGDWLAALWAKRERLSGKPMLIVWGAKDSIFRAGQELGRWQAAFPGARIVRLPGTGHFVAEESPDELSEAVTRFLRET